MASVGQAFDAEAGIEPARPTCVSMSNGASGSLTEREQRSHSILKFRL